MSNTNTTKDKFLLFQIINENDYTKINIPEETPFYETFVKDILNNIKDKNNEFYQVTLLELFFLNQNIYSNKTFETINKEDTTTVRYAVKPLLESDFFFTLKSQFEKNMSLSNLLEDITFTKDTKDNIDSSDNEEMIKKIKEEIMEKIPSFVSIQAIITAFVNIIDYYLIQVYLATTIDKNTTEVTQKLLFQVIQCNDFKNFVQSLQTQMNLQPPQVRILYFFKLKSYTILKNLKDMFFFINNYFKDKSSSTSTLTANTEKNILTVVEGYLNQINLIWKDIDKDKDQKSISKETTIRVDCSSIFPEIYNYFILFISLATFQVGLWFLFYVMYQVRKINKDFSSFLQNIILKGIKEDNDKIDYASMETILIPYLKNTNIINTNFTIHAPHNKEELLNYIEKIDEQIGNKLITEQDFDKMLVNTKTDQQTSQSITRLFRDIKIKIDHKYKGLLQEKTISGGRKMKKKFTNLSKIGLKKKKNIEETIKARDYYEKILGRKRFSLHSYTLKNKTATLPLWKNFLTV